MTWCARWIRRLRRVRRFRRIRKIRVPRRSERRPAEYGNTSGPLPWRVRTIAARVIIVAGIVIIVVIIIVSIVIIGTAGTAIVNLNTAAGAFFLRMQQIGIDNAYADRGI